MFEFFGGRLFFVLFIISSGNLFMLVFFLRYSMILDCGLTLVGLYLWNSYKASVSLQKIFVLASASPLRNHNLGLFFFFFFTLDHFNFSSVQLNHRSGQTVGMVLQGIFLPFPLNPFICLLFYVWNIFFLIHGFTEQIVLLCSWPI